MDCRQGSTDQRLLAKRKPEIPHRASRETESSHSVPIAGHGLFVQAWRVRVSVIACVFALVVKSMVKSRHTLASERSAVDFARTALLGSELSVRVITGSAAETKSFVSAARSS